MKFYKINLLSIILVLMIGIPANLKGDVIIDQSNNDDLLLVMVSGLQGEDVLAEMKSLIENEDSLLIYDIYIYNCDKQLKINENAEKLKHQINTTYKNYKEYFFVSYSLGGIITKQFFLNYQVEHNKKMENVKYLIFIGTPHLDDGFTVSTIQRVGGAIFRWALNPLLRDAARSSNIVNINKRWLNELEKKPDNKIKNITIFGRDDSLVDSEYIESDFKGNYVIIDGTHSELVMGTDKNHCGFEIVKSKLLNLDSDVNQLDCVNPGI